MHTGLWKIPMSTVVRPTPHCFPAMRLSSSGCEHLTVRYTVWYTWGVHCCDAHVWFTSMVWMGGSQPAGAHTLITGMHTGMSPFWCIDRVACSSQMCTCVCHSSGLTYKTTFTWWLEWRNKSTMKHNEEYKNSIYLRDGNNPHTSTGPIGREKWDLMWEFKGVQTHAQWLLLLSAECSAPTSNRQTST